MDLTAVCQTAQEIAREAGAYLKEGLDQPKAITRKSSDIDWVTQYDTGSEALIRQRLDAAFPDHGFYGEEGGDQTTDSPYVWYVDPIDGTTNFAHGVPFFSVSLALYENGRPLVGVIYDPMRDEAFHAVAGQGALVTRGGVSKRCWVSKTAVLTDALFATGFSYDRQQSRKSNVPEVSRFLQVAQGIRRTGSGALDIAYVAAGRFDGYWEQRLSCWDMAAGVLLVQEAGGKATFMDGSPFTIQSEFGLVASNGRLHDEMLTIFHETREKEMPSFP
ncbi:MAG: inositol monophosphatase family protein [Chloroflexota bacterium]